ncbi:MAG: D-Ala-D-Ala carboxypeptidase family metallohydrolase [Prevotellaceae bacterium]|nr:D-Ala-D-Ala carboxypeptidase family metallohydrolase [Prevotellaceae bacterium]
MKKINFELRELIRSNTAIKLGIDNMPKAASIYQNLFELIIYLLQPIRDGVGIPIVISSGYRCPELNKAVKGAKNSNHLYGLAADIDCGKEANQRIFNWVAHNWKTLPVDEFILGKDAGYVHVSLDKMKLNRILY